MNFSPSLQITIYLPCAHVTAIWIDWNGSEFHREFLIMTEREFNVFDRIQRFCLKVSSVSWNSSHLQRQRDIAACLPVCRIFNSDLYSLILKPPPVNLPSLWIPDTRISFWIQYNVYHSKSPLHIWVSWELLFSLSVRLLLFYFTNVTFYWHHLINDVANTTAVPTER